jgi:hypothetical protein
VKQRIRPMLGFKRFDNAVVTISGIELAEKIKKGQYKTGKLEAAERLRCRSGGTRRSPLEPNSQPLTRRSPTELPFGLSLHRSRVIDHSATSDRTVSGRARRSAP